MDVQANTFSRAVEVSDACSRMANTVAKYIVFVAFVIMAPIVCMQVFRRFVLGSSFPWVEEVARYLLIWITFLGSAIAVREKGHVAITSFVNMLNSRNLRCTQFVVELLMTVVFGLIVITGIDMTIATSRQYASSINISMAWVYLALPVGGVLMLLHTIVSILHLFQGRVRASNEETLRG